jgi:hypothetical protein
MSNNKKKDIDCEEQIGLNMTYEELKAELQKITNDIIGIYQIIHTDLTNNSKKPRYNFTAAQRVRVASIRLEKLFKSYRRLSVRFATKECKKQMIQSTCKKTPAIKLEKGKVLNDKRASTTTTKECPSPVVKRGRKAKV